MNKLKAKLLEYDEVYQTIPPHLMDEVVSLIEFLIYPKTIKDTYNAYESIERLPYKEFNDTDYIYINDIDQNEILVINRDKFIYW